MTQSSTSLVAKLLERAGGLDLLVGSGSLTTDDGVQLVWTMMGLEMSGVGLPEDGIFFSKFPMPCPSGNPA